MLNYRAILFDFDGVVANTEPIHSEIFRAVLAREGIHLTAQDHDERFLGVNDWAGFPKAFREVGRTLDPERARELVEEKSGLYRQRRHEVEPFRGVPNLLEAISNTCGLAIASGARGLDIEAILKEHDLFHHFRTIVSADEVSRSKPEPDVFLAALENLRKSQGPAQNLDTLTPQECLVVEDSPNGVRAAKAAGMDCLAVATSVRASELQEADRVVETLAFLSANELLRRGR